MPLRLTKPEMYQRSAETRPSAALGELAGLGEQGAHGLVPGRRSELDPRERKGDGGQVLRRLIVKLARDPPPLRLLGAEQPPGEDVQRAGATLDRGDVPVHDEQVEGSRQADARHAQLEPADRVPATKLQREPLPGTARHRSDSVGDLERRARAVALPQLHVRLSGLRQVPPVAGTRRPEPRLVCRKHTQIAVENGDPFGKAVDRRLE